MGLLQVISLLLQQPHFAFFGRGCPYWFNITKTVPLLLAVMGRHFFQMLDNRQMLRADLFTLPTSYAVSCLAKFLC